MPTLTPLAGLINGPPPVQPVTYLADPTPQATPEQRSGDPVDPRHEQLGEVARPYPWEGVAQGPHGPYGPENQMLGDTFSLVSPAGYLGQDPTADLQPQTRAAPWPAGVANGSVQPNEQAPRLVESFVIHSSDMGVGRQMLYRPAMDPTQDNWELIDRVDPGDSLQVPVPAQVSGYSGGFGSTDRVQSFSKNRQNEYEFDALHERRRYAQSPVPGNWMWLQPGGRPMIHPLAGPAALPIGQDSPFTGQNTGASFNADGSVLSDLPAEYTSPLDPELSGPLPVGNSMPASSWVLT